jgi:hypothetical protein
MIIKICESVPPDRSNNPMTDHSKTLANPGSPQWRCVRVFDGTNVFAERRRRVLA